MGYEIFNCGLDMLDELDEFYDRVNEHLENTINYPHWRRGEYPGRESIREAIESGSQYICMADGRIAGAFVLNDDPGGDYGAGEWRVPLSCGEYMIIHTLAVDPELGGRDIGGEMVRYCIDKAKNDGYKAVRLDVVPTNTPACRLYEKEGFLFAGEKDLGRGYEDIPTFLLYELNL